MNKKDEKLKVISKIIYVFATIGYVMCFIALSVIVLAMVLLPMLIGKVDIKNDNIIVKNNENTLKIKDKDNKIIVTVNNMKILEESNKEVINWIKTINNSSKSSITLYIEIILSFTLISIILTILILRHLKKLFKNINKEDSPFTMDNIYHIKRIAMIMIIGLFLPVISSIILELLIHTDINIKYNVYSIFEILIIFAIAYIFEYGYYLQNSKLEK